MGLRGRVYGLDMAPSMLAETREHATLAGIAGVEFIEGRMEAIPPPDRSVGGAMRLKEEVDHVLSPDSA